MSNETRPTSSATDEQIERMLMHAASFCGMDGYPSLRVDRFPHNAERGGFHEGQIAYEAGLYFHRGRPDLKVPPARSYREAIDGLYVAFGKMIRDEAARLEKEAAREVETAMFWRTAAEKWGQS